jgi:hypothetical protein
MIAEAIAGSSAPEEILVGTPDRFGSMVIAAEMTGRVARVVEEDPRSCDLIVQRFMSYTSANALLSADGRDFESVAAERSIGAREPSLRRSQWRFLPAANRSAD